MSITVTVAESARDMREFIHFPWKIYRDDPYWVPPLLIEQKKLLSRSKNPFFRHSKAQYFIARKNGTAAGRIAAIRNNNHLRIYNDNVGFFGFFECMDDTGVADALLGAACQWVQDEGLSTIRGPMNFSVNDEIGLLVDGFRSSPMVMMTHNPPYYENLISRFGFEKAMDLYAYYIDHAETIPERLERGVKILKKRGKFSVRKIRMKQLDREIEHIKKVYNAAWAENWGAVYMTDEEFDHLAQQLKQIVDPDIIFLAEIDDEVVGFSITVPNINEALRKLNGRLLPLGIFKLMWNLRKISSARVLVLGVLKPYRNRGIDTVFYYETFKNGLAKGYNTGEMSWILENNYAMRTPLENMGARIYKTYRIYDKKLT